MTRVIVTVEEEQDGKTTTILHIPIKEFTAGIQFGETSEAVSYAQRCVSWIRRKQVTIKKIR